MTRLFKGGIHPTGKKEITRKKPLMVPEEAPKTIILPLKSANGASTIPIVSEGDSVAQGQKVAAIGERGSVPLFSGISGVVRSIGHEPHPLWGWSEGIVIENDFQNRQVTYPHFPDYEELTQEQLITLVQERGVVGMSREVTLAYEKILASRGKVDTLIINATECQPYLTSDYRLLIERQDTVVWGAQILANTLGVNEIVFAVQGDKLDAIEGLEKTIGWNRETMRICTIPTKYPFGEESQVVRFVKGVEIPTGEGAVWANCVIFNIATTYAVGECIVGGSMPTHRAVTVTGGALQRPRNLWVPIGVSVDYLIQCAGGLRENPSVVLVGGSMNGLPQTDLRVPILSNSGGKYL
ncbi:MAG: RnfABCDGE type electron transport complex subunit C, partial [Eubacteriales bacterium]